MRLLLAPVCLVVLGCTLATQSPVETVAAGPDEPPLEDLRTRKTGIDWPCFLGSNHDSTSPEKGIVSPWPKEGPRRVWDRPIGIGYAMPSISKGRLYLFDRQRNSCRLQCWKAETAEPLWSFEYPTDYRDKYNYNGGPRCCPVIDGNRVYIFGPEGMLHCLRASDGKLIWKVDTQAEFNVLQNFFGVGSTPIIEGDLLLVHVGGSPPGSREDDFMDLKGNGSALVAFDKYTGKVRYKVDNELASYASPVTATINGRRWCFVFARGGLLALEPASGKVDFHFPWRANMLESVNASNPVVVGNRVLITECYERGAALLEVKPGGYRQIWSDEGQGRRKSLACHWMTPIHVDGYVYGSSGRHTNDAELRCVELATGKVKWREPALTRSSLLRVDGHFICLGEYGKLHLIKINPEKYEEISTCDLTDAEGTALLDYPCWAAPILSNGLLYVRGDKRLVCLELIPRR